MADVEKERKDADGRPQRAKTATASIDSRKVRSEQPVEADCDGDDAGVSHRASNVSVSDGEQRRDIKKTMNRSSSVAVIESDTDAPQRLIVVSSKIRNNSVMQSAVLSNVLFVQYKYENATTDSCLGRFHVITVISDYLFILLLKS